MSAFDYQNSTITKYRAGTSSDPYIDITESKKVINGVIQLNEIPVSLNKVRITGYYEVPTSNTKDLATNEYRVDYNEGLVYFNPAAEGLTLTAIFKGRGNNFLSISRIWTKQEDGNVVQTLGDIIDAGQDVIDELPHLNQTIDNAQDATNSANTAASNANAKATLANTATTNANTARDNAITAKDNAVTATTQANTARDSANTAASAANVAKTNADTATANANTATTNANTARDNANTKATYAQTQGDYAKAKGDYAAELINKGDYVAGTTYKPLNIVVYNDTVYQNIVQSTGILPTNTTHWKMIMQLSAFATWSTIINKPDATTAQKGIVQLADNADSTSTSLAPTANALKKVNDNLSAQLAEIANIDPTTYQGLLGTELIDGTGWVVPTGWTGSFASGFVHTVGQTTSLSRPIPTTGTRFFQVSFRVESPTPAGVPNASSDFTVSIGNSTPFVTYQGGGNFNYSFGIQSVSDGDLVFTPGATFDGTIKNISVKEISGELTPLTKITDVYGNIFREERVTTPWLRNIFIGKDSGKTNTTGHENVSIGDLSMVNNTSGYWNEASGYGALQHNTTGSRNVADGYQALNANISGDRNIAIGSFTLIRNTHGRQNIALGADALWVNTIGSRNIALGMGAMGENTIGNENIAIGYITLEQNVSGNNNIAIGQNALLNNTISHNSVAIGREALKNSNGLTANALNTAVGYAAANRTTSGTSNSAFGASSLAANLGGNENAVFGHYAAASGALGDLTQNAIFGAFAGNFLTGGANNNTLIGFGAGRALTSGNNNILIGRNVEGSSPTVSGEINIGGVFRSNVFTKRATIGDGIANPTARLHLGAGSAAAQSAPLKFTNGVLMSTPEPGAIEYDGQKYYATFASGVRKEIAFVA